MPKKSCLPVKLLQSICQFPEALWLNPILNLQTVTEQERNNQLKLCREHHLIQQEMIGSIQNGADVRQNDNAVKIIL